MAAGRPSSSATSSAATRQAVAPSLSPAALPAVTRPCGRTGVRSVASASFVVPGRGGSSAEARPQPSSALRSATPTSDSWMTPSCVRPADPLRLIAAYASERSRVIAG